MKNLFFAVLMITALNLTAQPFEKNKERQNFTPDQIAELQTKKMTLHLELTEKQQQQILEIHKKNAEERKLKMEDRKILREKGEKSTNEDLFKIKSTRLDMQIAHQAKMKKILTESQFESWKKARNQRTHRMKKKALQKRMKARKNPSPRK